jgi:GT2 family glycosyltransferase
MQFFIDGRWVSAKQARKIRDKKLNRKPISQKPNNDVLKKYNGKKIADIVIPHHDRHDHLKECLDCLPNSIFNIIIVSGGSFAENCNKGAKLAKTDNIIILNDDTIPNPEYLIKMCEMNEDIVGASQQMPEVSKIFYGIRFDSNRPLLATDKDSVIIPSGFLMRFKKQAWKKLKGFDEKYINGAEDVDLGLRALKAEMSIGIFEKPILHKHSQSEGRYRFAAKNERMVRKKWTEKKISDLFPLISIVIPSRVDEDFECIKSIENQTYPNIEIIKVIDKQKKGAGATRNRGIKKAKGEYIYFCDNDIKLFPDSIFKMYNHLKANNKYDWTFGKFYWDKHLINERKSQKVPRKGTKKYVDYFEFISACSMVRASVKPKFDPKMKRFEDWDLWCSLDEKGHKGLFIDEVLFETARNREGKKPVKKDDPDKWKDILYKKHNIKQ